MASLRGGSDRDFETMLLTTSCCELIGHALGFLWLEQIVNSLFPNEVIVPFGDVFEAATKFGDTAFTTTAGALSKLQLEEVIAGALATYIDGGARRQGALDALQKMPADCGAGADGVYAGTELVIRTKDPDALLAASRLHRIVTQHPFQAELEPLATPTAFVEKIGSLFTRSFLKERGEAVLADIVALTGRTEAAVRDQLLGDLMSSEASLQSNSASGSTVRDSMQLTTRAAERDAATHRKGPL